MATHRPVRRRHPVPTLLAALALLVAGAAPGGSSTPAGPGDAGRFSGVAVTVVVDDKEGADATTRVHVVSGDAAVTLPDDLAEDLSGGERVTVTIPGTEGLDAAEAFRRTDAGRTTVASLEVTRATQPASQLGQHRVVVAPVHLSGPAPSTPTVSQLRQLVTGVNSYLSTTTNGQIGVVEHTVRPWTRIDVGGSSCEHMYNAVFGSDLAVRTAGTMPPSPVNHVVFYTADLGCPFVGIATMGVGAHGYPVTWLNGDSSVSTAAHELGHNMGLGHTGRIECYSGSGAVVVGLSTSCSTFTYDDAYDVMAAPLTDLTTGVPGEMAAYHQRRLGTLTTGQVPVVGAGTYTLHRLSAGSGVRGLQVPITPRRTLQLEYRAPARLDSWIQSFPATDGPPGPGAGVLVRVVDPTAPTDDLSTVDLQARDATYHVPAPGGGHYVVRSDTPSFLPVGTTWQVQGASPATSITVTSAGATSATVEIAGPRATSTERWSGSTRYATAARIATTAYPAGASTVFLASGTDFPDALAGSPVAGTRGAPMLLTHPDRLTGAAGTALQTLGATTVVILGGPAAVSEAVRDELVGRGLTVQRWSGANRYATAVEISRRAFPAGADCLYVASATAFPDALSGAPAAGAAGCSMLLVASTSVRDEVLAEVDRLDPGHVVFLGGETAISAQAAAQVMAKADGATQVRMEGGNRWATSAAVARQGSFATPRAQVFVASGTDYPDALALAAVAAHRRAPLLLTRPDSLPGAIDTEIRRLATPRAVIAGGTVAVSTTVQAQVKAALR